MWYRKLAVCMRASRILPETRKYLIDFYDTTTGGTNPKAHTFTKDPKTCLISQNPRSTT